ncbi:MAG: methionine biosynthesis protein MetW [Candidatus Marinamargulisbacteria bacterium]
MKLYQTIVFDQIKPGERVIDLGCGDGELLQELRQKKNCEGYGIEQHFDEIIMAMRRGIPVFQGDVLDGLKSFEDGAFDVAILSQTLQQVMHPNRLLTEMCRVAKRVIVTFPNFAYWRVRFHLAWHGVSPKTSQLPFDWHSTPNIRVITIKEFRQLCHDRDIQIVKEIPLVKYRFQRWVFPLRFTNFLTEKGIFIIQMG